MSSEVWDADSDNETSGYMNKAGKWKDRLGLGKSGAAIKLILVVSSDGTIRERFARLLSQIGAPYMLERDKSNALVRILELDVRILIADIEDKGESMDFIRLVKEMRPKLPVLAVTSDRSRAKQNHLLDRGAEVVLVKPFEEKTVVNKIRTLIEI